MSSMATVAQEKKNGEGVFPKGDFAARIVIAPHNNHTVMARCFKGYANRLTGASKRFFQALVDDVSSDRSNNWTPNRAVENYIQAEVERIAPMPLVLDQMSNFVDRVFGFAPNGSVPMTSEEPLSEKRQKARQETIGRIHEMVEEARKLPMPEIREKRSEWAGHVLELIDLAAQNYLQENSRTTNKRGFFSLG